jgi:hypothetical protein
MNGITDETVLDRATNLAGPEFPVGTLEPFFNAAHYLFYDTIRYLRRHREHVGVN